MYVVAKLVKLAFSALCATRVTYLGLGLGAFAFVGFFLTSLAPGKLGAQPAPQCYSIKNDDSPFADEANDEKPEQSTQSEIWCWQELDQPTGAMLIFHSEPNGYTSPELTFVIDSEGMITHTSLLAGKRSVHTVHSSFNPLPVPLTPPADAERVAQPQPIGAATVGTPEKALEILSTERPAFADISIKQEGKFAVSVGDNGLPWRAYWFPHSSGRMHNGPDSPMAKFDKFMLGRTGKNPGAQKWEKNRHRFSGISWAGHCNGWAAASIMYPEPKQTWTDALTGVSFTPLDQKALLIERAYCPKHTFFGHHFRGRATDNKSDIRPVDFHNALAYYLGELKKPVLMDMMNHEPVENRVVSGYEMNIKQLAPYQFRISTTLTIHTYDTKPADEAGVAKVLTRTYTYNIWTDEAGHAVKGSWLTSNPDFFWVPLTSGNCVDANPAVTDHWVAAVGAPLRLPGW